MSSPAPADVPNAWDFYLCRVDEEPASISLNLWFANHAPLEDAATVFIATIIMDEAGDHGMGTPDALARIGPMEDRLVDAAAAQGLHHVGRLRNKGRWQLTFYGPAHKAPGWEALASEALGAGRMGFATKADPEWGYYFDFLCPDPERWQWILDRRVVDQLTQHGDDPRKPRPVDHQVTFSARETRDAFLEAARTLGFQAVARDDGKGDRPFAGTLTRDDPAELGHIHEVVMGLTRVAAQHDGAYDGWGCPIASP